MTLELARFASIITQHQRDSSEFLARGSSSGRAGEIIEMSNGVFGDRY